MVKIRGQRLREVTQGCGESVGLGRPPGSITASFRAALYSLHCAFSDLTLHSLLGEGNYC